MIPLECQEMRGYVGKEINHFIRTQEVIFIPSIILIL